MALIKRSQRIKVGDILRKALDLHNQDKNQEALKLLSQAHQLAPKDPVILSFLGSIQLKCGLYSEAAVSCSKALRYNPSEYDAYLMDGNFLEKYMRISTFFRRQKRHTGKD
mgnify:CR=1 FL=1